VSWPAASQTPVAGCRWPTAKTGLTVLSLTVPPRWNVPSELNVPWGALVSQLRSVTCTNQTPASPFAAADWVDCATAGTGASSRTDRENSVVTRRRIECGEQVLVIRASPLAGIV